MFSRLFANHKGCFKYNFMKLVKFDFSKIVSIKLPDLGEGTKEATIRTWYKKEGDIVDEEEKVVEVFTDKLVADIPSPAKGKVHKVYYTPDQPCLVGKALCDILVEEGTEKKETNTEVVKEHKEKESLNELGIQDILTAEAEKRTPILENRPNKTTPAVRFMLKQYNIRPELVTPTGKNNRILKEDVINYVSSLKHPIPPKHAQVAKEHSPKSHHQSHHSKHEDRSHKKEGIEADKTIKLVGFQKAMTKTMTQSTQIPSFLYTDEFNVDKLVKIRKEMNKLEHGKIKFTYMPFIIKAVSNALLEFPHINSNVNPKLGDDGYIFEYTVKKDHNISIAIDSPEGLVVPNIKKVQEKSLIQIQRELNELRDRAENRKLTSDDLKDGTFTVSNIGNIGGKVLSPVILPPQVCIIGVSKFFDSVQVVPSTSDYHDTQAYHLMENKNLAVLFHKAVNLCISADHRVIDGASVARFSEVLKSYIENPLRIWIGK